MDPYWSQPLAYTPGHQRGWSGSTVSFSQPSVQPNPKAPSMDSSRTLGKSRSRGTWTLEITTILIAFGAVGAIVGIVARFNGEGLPDWPYYITLNTVIAMLATVAVAAMSTSLQNGLSQLKWIRFKERRAPLADMEVFDEASRGAWGSLKLLVTARGGFLGSLGATLAILSLAFSPFAQQVVTYETRPYVLNETNGAEIPRALSYEGALHGTTTPTGFVPILPLKSAVYNGLFAENGRPGAALKFECQTGNCTWPSFETLGVCHECVDLTPFMTKYCAQGEDSGNCGWEVPQGGKLNDSSVVFSMTPLIPDAKGDMPHSTILRLIFMGTEAKDQDAGNLNPWAQQCTLSACLQTLDSAVVNGALSENMTESRINQTVVDTTRASADADLGVYVMGGNDTTYLLGRDAMLSMRGWFASVFAAGAAVRTQQDFNRTITDNSVVVNLTVGISSGETFFDSDIVTAFYWNYYEYQARDGLAMLMSDVAISMTVAFRSFQGAVPVAGRALAERAFVKVRWGFAVLPIVVVTGAALFLVAAIHRTHHSRTKPLKSSALAMLFHGLDDDIRSQFGRVGSLKDKKRQAKGLKVQLDESGDGGSLLRA